MHGLRLAINFLTRLKIGSPVLSNPQGFSLATYYFPLVGLFIGIILMITAGIFKAILQPFTVAALILLIEVYITGGLHLDGLIDTCDGLLSGQNRGKTLEIMQDSRVGAMGVIGLCLVLLLKLVFFAELILQPAEQHYALLLMPFIGRWAMTYAVLFFPSAHPEGMGQLFKKNLNRKGFWFISLYCLSLFVFIIFLFSILISRTIFGQELAIILCVFLLTLGWVYYITKRINSLIGGLTGDTYGAINELTEVVFLGSYLIFSRIGSSLLSLL